MKLLRSVLSAVLGLFVDDGSLALHIVVLVFGAAFFVEGAGLRPLIGALGILAGCLLILSVSLARKKRESSRHQGRRA